MPAETESEDVNAPENNRSPVPLANVPMLKYVIVLLPAVAAGKLIAAALEKVPDAVVHPALLRATAARA